jgi:predicted TIM-barrel fold metal-dependent hydrolase
LWDALAALGWHLELHTDIGRLPGVLAQLPAALPLVVDHMGKPETVAPRDASVRALAARAQQASVHVKLSGAYRLGGLDAGALARLWLGELGPTASAMGQRLALHQP